MAVTLNLSIRLELLYTVVRVTALSMEVRNEMALPLLTSTTSSVEQAVMAAAARAANKNFVFIDFEKY